MSSTGSGRIIALRWQLSDELLVLLARSSPAHIGIPYGCGSQAEQGHQLPHNVRWMRWLHGNFSMGQGSHMDCPPHFFDIPSPAPDLVPVGQCKKCGHERTMTNTDEHSYWKNRTGSRPSPLKTPLKPEKKSP